MKRPPAALVILAALIVGANPGVGAQTSPAVEIREGNVSILPGERMLLHADPVQTGAAAAGPSSTAAGLAQGGPVQTGAGAPQWSSSAPLVATVDGAGLVIGVAPGSALVTVRWAGGSDTVVVSVRALAAQPPPVALRATRPARPAWTPAELRERPPVAPMPDAPRARALAERWIELELPEVPLALPAAGEAARYSIESPDDPAYAAAVDPARRRPSRVQYRWFPERAPFTPSEAAAAQGQRAADGQAGYLVVVRRIFLKTQADRPLRLGARYTVRVDASVYAAGAQAQVPGGAVQVRGGAAPLPPAQAPLPGPAALAFRYPGNDAKAVIHVNQEAWAPGGPKIAYLSAWLGPDGPGNRGWIDFEADLPSWTGAFSVLPESGGAPLFTGKAERTRNPAEERYAGGAVWKLDFTSFDTPGRYRLQLPGVGLSAPFGIGPANFDHVVYTAMRGMLHLRDGDHGLDKPAVTRWTRPPAHLDDAIEQSSGRGIDLAGGHMDAGDREKIPLNMALASSYYLSAARLFPDRVLALGERLQIPESGNGIPDYLDELFWELDALYKMVALTSSEGALTAWVKPAASNFEKGQPPEGSKGRIWYDQTQGRLKSATLAAAGALAMAAADPLVRAHSGGTHPDRAAAYLAAARRAWTAFAVHEFDERWWRDDASYNGGVWRLGKKPWSGQLLFAAANLYEATGDPVFLERLQREWPAGPADLVLYGVDASGLILQTYLMVALSSQPGMPPEFSRRAREWLFDVVSRMNRLPQGEPVFGILFQSAVEQAVGWFFSGLRTGFPNLLCWGLLRGAPESAAWRDRVASTWNYLLGANPASRSHISGLGDPENRPRWIVNEIWDYRWREGQAGAQAGGARAGSSGWVEPPPGLVEADLQRGDFGPWFNSPYNAARTKEMDPPIQGVPLFHRLTDAWNVTNEASSHTAAVMAAIALPFVMDAVR